MDEQRGSIPSGDTDTIAALATAAGIGAVAIVRISGPDAATHARALTRKELRPRIAELCTFRSREGERIDQGIALYFPAPRSYTGEDVVELHCHGGAVVADWLLETLHAAGARPAEAGEFTLRAFLNDKLDLAQAEAVADLIGSGSRAAARAASRSLSGRFSTRVAAVQSALTAVRVEIEAWLDFPDEELDRAAVKRLGADLERLGSDLDTLLAEAEQGAVLRDGLDIAIAGPPNAGKSSLLNALSGHDTAIVTEIPGTTRDALRERVTLDGLALTLVDTAGIREAGDPVEIEGVRRARDASRTADRVLWLADIGAGERAGVAAAREALGDDVPVTVVLNKIDVSGHEAAVLELDGIAVVRVSALTGAGLELLVEHLKAVAGFAGDSAGTFSARRRHVAALGRATRAVTQARAALDAGMEVAAEDLRAAQTALSELTGEHTSDDLLGEIFSSFCIGK